MEQFSRLFIVIGIVFVLFGLVMSLGGRLPLGRLPGDIMIKRENFTFYFPVMTGIVISVVLSLLFRLYNRLF